MFTLFSEKWERILFVIIVITTVIFLSDAFCPETSEASGAVITTVTATAVQSISDTISMRSFSK